MCGDITIGNNCYIGERSTILPGISIGENCIIGCGSIVTHDIPANSVAAGVPCKVIRKRDEYVEKVKLAMQGGGTTVLFRLGLYA